MPWIELVTWFIERGARETLGPLPEVAPCRIIPLSQIFATLSSYVQLIQRRSDSEGIRWNLIRTT